MVNQTVTQVGKDALKHHFLHPPGSYQALAAVQEVIKYWASVLPTKQIITNGTLTMVEKFFETADEYSRPPGNFGHALGDRIQKLLNKNQHSFAQYSLSHLADFFKGCAALVALLSQSNLPTLLISTLQKMQEDLTHKAMSEVLTVDKSTAYRKLQLIRFRARRELKQPVLRLIELYALIDAWQAMAKATLIHKWVFPALTEAKPTLFLAKNVYHPLLTHPKGYDISFSEGCNFMILTGANMSGKTTFMRCLGVAALLAHLGMGVPATELTISFTEGIITNMHVEDDILKGESYFFAEVQRMKMTAQKLLQIEPHIVLMDELFKGTNVHDAYECTRAVIEGLLNHPHHIIILSTHLYEVAQHFSAADNIFFAYFETTMGSENTYSFTYNLKPGISKDRIGYMILEQEGVLALLGKKVLNK